MEVAVKNAQRGSKVDRERIAALAGRALTLLGRPDAEVSVLLVSDRRMRELNRTYRNRRETTDVLAFPQTEGPGPPPGNDLFGDVVISVQTAARQAREAGLSLWEEIDRLLVHGLLHLAGFRHHGPASEARRMGAWSRRILKERPG